MGQTKLIDLTHSLNSKIPIWDGSCGFQMRIAHDYAEGAGKDKFRVQKLETFAGVGTHIDAPAHCFQGTATVDVLNLDCLVTDCVVIKVDDVADENFVLMPDAILEFEQKYGRIKANAFVIIYFGWDRFWVMPTDYRNDLKFPSVHKSVGLMLLERDIAGLGTDTLSPDSGGKEFPIHRILLGAGKYIVENVANAKQLPPVGSKIMVMPMKIAEGTEAPIRLVAEVES